MCRSGWLCIRDATFIDAACETPPRRAIKDSTYLPPQQKNRRKPLPQPSSNTVEAIKRVVLDPRNGPKVMWICIARLSGSKEPKLFKEHLCQDFILYMNDKKALGPDDVATFHRWKKCSAARDEVHGPNAYFRRVVGCELNDPCWMCGRTVKDSNLTVK